MQSYMILHKTEWERMKRQINPEPEEFANQKQEYLQTLADRSQGWMKNWPDTTTGHIAQLEKKKDNEHKANIAFIKSYTNKQKQLANPADAVKKAKQLIFEKSCYGKQLLSALLESKAMDIRDAQIKFKEDIKTNEADIAKQQENAFKDIGINTFQDKDAEREKKHKSAFVKCISYNKEIAAQKREKELQTKIKKIEDDLEAHRLLKQGIELEKMEEEAVKQCVKKEIELYAEEMKEIKRIKTLENELDNSLIEMHKRRQDRIKCKSKDVFQKIHHGRPDTKWSKYLYKQIEELQNQEMKKYEVFVDKGIKTLENRALEKEKAKTNKAYNRFLVDEVNNKVAREARLNKMHANKCICYRNSLCLKTTGMKTKTNTNDKRKTHEVKSYEDASADKTKCLQENAQKKYQFLAPQRQLHEDLKKREKELSGWNGTKHEHEYFAQQAGDVLKEIKHKYLARKVVDEYRKSNCLDATTLPVPNY